jgi:hypothetical protein
MNPLDRSFQRLLNAAAKARRNAAEPLPFSMEARVLAQWRDLEVEDDFAMVLKLFQRAIVFAALIMSLSGVWNYFETKREAGTMPLASYAMRMQLPP